MSYYPKGFLPPADEVDDFDKYDATPFGGGYDITLTYGCPLSPSEETCYPSASTSLHFDYDRPCYDSYAQPCAYLQKAVEKEYRSYAHFEPRPAPAPYGGPPPPGPVYCRPQPMYGFQPGTDRPGGGPHEYGKPEPEFGSGYGRTPGYGPGLGSEYGRRPENEHPPPDNYNYGRRPEYERPGNYGSGYERRTGPEYGSGYGRGAEGSWGYGYNQGRNDYRRHGYGDGEEKPRHEHHHYHH